MLGPTLPHWTDVELFNLSFDDAGLAGRLTLTPDLARPDGILYGGTAIAASVAAMEAATGRDALWITTQYAATTGVGSVIELATDVLASGKAISQVHVTGRHEGRVLFVSVGSTATPRPDGLDGQYETMPDVSGPDDSAGSPFGRADLPPAFHRNMEYRVAEFGRKGDRSPHMAMWARLSGGYSMTRAGLAYVADMVPPAIARAAGFLGGGPSLDNSLRFGPLPDDTTWVLLELQGHLAYGAHGHGSVRIWTPSGQLVAVGGQSANMVHVVPSESGEWPFPRGVR